MQKNSGARFFTPFFIVSEQSHREYWLIHLSMHERARDEMTKLHWALQNQFRHNGGAGLNMFGYDPRKDDGLSGQEAFKDFDFDDAARARTESQLRVDIPEELNRYPEGVSLAKLVSETVNTTPAHTEMYKDALGYFLDDKNIVIVSPDGERRRKGQRVGSKDIITVAKQTTLFFRKRF